MNEFVKTYYRARKLAKYVHNQNYEIEYGRKSGIMSDIDLIIMEPKRIREIKNPSEEIQMTAVKSYQYFENPDGEPVVYLPDYYYNNEPIQFIENPYESVQFYVIKIDLRMISHINNPTENVQLYVVKKRPKLYGSIKNICEKAKLYVVSDYGYRIKDFENPSEELQLAAVNERPYNIKVIDRPTENVKRLFKEKTGLDYE